MITHDIIIDPIVNKLGAWTLPIVNLLASKLTTFKYSDIKFQMGKNFYPGEKWCNSWDPHAKWHVESGIALVDFIFFADEMYRLLNSVK